MEITLDWISGICWGLVYLLAIVFGLKNKTICIPSVCICLNFSWELLCVIFRLVARMPMDRGYIIHVVWALLDLGILLLWFRYSSEGAFYKKILILFGISIVMLGVTCLLGYWIEIAFAINLIMSVLFLLNIDKTGYAYSLSIAVLKCVGTLSATILYGLIYKNIFALSIGGMCLIADIIYIVGLIKHRVYMVK